MIGMMNVGTDANVEFYATNRQSSLYARKVSKDSRSYTPEGRVFINGAPVFQETPEDLWQGLIQKAVTKKIIKESIEPKQGGLASALRRLSSKLTKPLSRVSSDAAGEKAAETEIVKKPEEKKEFVTVIRINSVDNGRSLKVRPHRRFNDDIDLPLIEGGILRRLMEEQAIQEEGEPTPERRTPPTGSIQHDSGRASLDESSEVTVKRF